MGVIIVGYRKSVGFLLSIIFNIVALFIADYFIDALKIDSLVALIFSALLLTLFNRFLKPLLIFIALPLTILTLGLFYPVINVVILKLVDFFLDSFSISGFFWAILVSFIIAVVNWILNGIIDRDLGKNSHII